MKDHKRNICSPFFLSHYWGLGACFAGALLFWGVLWFPPFLMPSTSPSEICDNGIDDDNDGLIDLNDPDCECPLVEVISLIPNPSFEDKICCPYRQSQLRCAAGWIQASEATTDFIHTCGWMGWDDFPPVPQPFPDGEGVVGFRDGVVMNGGQSYPNWKEYAGACLDSPMLKDTLYRFEFDLGFLDSMSSPPLDVTLFGTKDCRFLPFNSNNPNFGCPTNGLNWVQLAAVSVKAKTAGRGWVKAAFEFRPTTNISAIAIGPSCSVVIDRYPLYYLFDNLILNDKASYDFKVSTVGNPCSDDFTLKIPYNALLTYQWYKEGIALIGETSAQLSSTQGEGRYQVRLLKGQECKIVYFDYLIPHIKTQVSHTICEGESFTFDGQELTAPGIYSATFSSVDGCDSTTVLDLNVSGLQADTVYAHLFLGEKYQYEGMTYDDAGEYLVNLQSSANCDSLIWLVLDYYQVYFPNVFSPNGDGINDYFNALGADELLSVVDLKVFDRWGGLVYEGKNLSPSEAEGWNGLRRGATANPGVYVYTATLLMDDGKERQLAGSVLLFL